MGEAQPAPGHAPTAPGVTARRVRAASPALAWVLGGAVLVLAAAAVVLSALIDQLSVRSIAAGVVIVLAFAGVGLVIARRLCGSTPAAIWPAAVIWPDGWPARRAG